MNHNAKKKKTKKMQTCIGDRGRKLVGKVGDSYEHTHIYTVISNKKKTSKTIDLSMLERERESNTCRR